MTLPEALLKRLAKRGIISDAQKVGANQNQPPLLSAGTADEDSDQDNNKERDSENTSDQSDEKDDDVDDDRRDAEVINEEIIAEDYDEYDQVNPEAYEYASKKKSTPALEWTEKMKQKMTKRYGYQSVDGCQNKYNIYHLCTMYCVKRYGEVEFEIEKEYEKRTKRLLERYPLPKNWRKEYDIGCKAFYFYNKDTRVVAWLPPTHPDAKLTKSAKQLRRELMEEQKQKDATSEATPPTVIVESYPPPAKPLIGPTNTTALGSSNVGPGVENLKPPIVNPPKRPAKQHPGSGEREDEKRQRTFSSGNDSGAGESGAADQVDRDRDYRDRNRDRRERDRDRDRDRDRRGDRDRSPPARGDDNRFGARDRDRNRDRDRERDYRDHRDRRPPRGPPKSAPLDPMDPAAYSDIPRGTWSAGLEAQSQSAAGSKKEKNDRKKPQLTSPKSDGDEDDGDEGAHEVLKISAVQEFHQDEDVDDDIE